MISFFTAMIKLQLPEIFKQNPSHRVRLLLQPFNNEIRMPNRIRHFKFKIYNKSHVYLYSNSFVALGKGQCKFSGFFYLLLKSVSS